MVLRTRSFEGESKDGLLIEIGVQVRECSKKDFQEITFLKVVVYYEVMKLERGVSDESLFEKKISGEVLE